MSNATKFLLLAASMVVVAVIVVIEMTHARSSKTIASDMTMQANEMISSESNYDYTQYHGATMRGSEVWNLIYKYSGTSIFITVINQNDTFSFSDFTTSHDPKKADGTKNEFYISAQDFYMCSMERSESGEITAISFKEK